MNFLTCVGMGMHATLFGLVLHRAGIRITTKPNLTLLLMAADCLAITIFALGTRQ